MSKLAEKLQAAGLKFTVDGSVLRGHFALRSGRTSKFVIESGVGDNGKEESHLLIPVCHAAIGNAMLPLCEQLMGSEECEVVGAGDKASLKIEIPATMGGTQIVAAIIQVCICADDLGEQMMDGEDCDEEDCDDEEDDDEEDDDKERDDADDDL